ncbi:hypothetical protein CALCODRAFT_556721, partial [Calocera cornea HHB12733]
MYRSVFFSNGTSLGKFVRHLASYRLNAGCPASLACSFTFEGGSAPEDSRDIVTVLAMMPNLRRVS